MDLYIIVETIHETEFRIAMRSDRYISDVSMWMCLADVYYLGEIHENNKPGMARYNRFKTFADAKKAVEELRSPRIDNEIEDEEQMNELCQEDRGI